MPIRMVTDLDIQAFVDGELGPDEADKIRAFIDRDMNAWQRYHMLCRQRDLLKDWHENEINEKGSIQQD